MIESKGQYESEISKAITHWEKEYLGRGSLAVKADIFRDMIIITLKGILTPAEYKVANSQNSYLSIKSVRTNLVESGVNELKEIIQNITMQCVVSFHTDLSTKTGERIMIFKLENNFEELFK
ncbi:DUF2294 domain-containing protein [Staphylococcus massiliensis]|uniref:Na+-translocating membrane potential-generating system MpsC domain-containing protein n=1 Tax=Staphylococcus massiliensis S46 TaxID=1229783 RepID=K9AUZ6_9STAP|nr:DUF2294 domain-containing protein [Staphylococcus massiliensis]EKU45295.1 hypothetical protein C273_11466 [Staphylococcus massiliensis S46]MCG3400681.1 DUF2294 domain-containing protein [Staphylococcus massiliensis]MCG3413604.1 DUF2294 domain-containing protein [Staphylococcus massiliensis]